MLWIKTHWHTLVAFFAGGCWIFYEAAGQRDGWGSPDKARRTIPEIQIHGAQSVSEETQVTSSVCIPLAGVLRALMSTHGAMVRCSLPPLVQVEEPDPANHTDTWNPATHAEKKGAYIGTGRRPDLAEGVFPPEAFVQTAAVLFTGHDGTHGDTLSIGWQCLLQGFSATD